MMKRLIKLFDNSNYTYESSRGRGVGSKTFPFTHLKKLLFWANQENLVFGIWICTIEFIWIRKEFFPFQDKLLICLTLKIWLKSDLWINM